MHTLRTRLGIALASAALLAGCGTASPSRPATATPPTPRLYTDANAAAVWAHPEQHLGALVEVRGTVRTATRIRGGVLLALVLPGSAAPVGAHVYDRHFHPHAADIVTVRGRVRGPLGSPDVPGVPLAVALDPGTAILDASAATAAHPRVIPGSPRSAPRRPQVQSSRRGPVWPPKRQR